MKVVGKKKLTANKWQHLFITYDGSGRAAGTRVFSMERNLSTPWRRMG